MVAGHAEQVSDAQLGQPQGEIAGDRALRADGDHERSPCRSGPGVVTGGA